MLFDVQKQPKGRTILQKGKNKEIRVPSTCSTATTVNGEATRADIIQGMGLTPRVLVREYWKSLDLLSLILEGCI